MIRRSVEYSISCDACGESLEYKKDHPLTSYHYHAMTEGNPEHIKEVAESYGWSINSEVHLCEECKINKPK